MLTEFAFIFGMNIAPLALILPKALFCYFQYFTTDLGNEAFGLPMPLWWVSMNAIYSTLTFNIILLLTFIISKRFPFNWKNPIVYLITIAIQFEMSINPARYIVCILGIVFASHVFEMELIENSINELRILQNNFKNGTQSRPENFELLCKLIRFHSDGKKLSTISKEIIHRKLIAAIASWWHDGREFSMNIFVWDAFK